MKTCLVVPFYFGARRKEHESEIYISDFKEFTAEELYNKIRALQLRI